MKKKIAAAALGLLLVVGTGAAAGASAGTYEQPAAQNETYASPAKDETVYVNLNADGSVSSIHVVNRIEVPQDGVYMDYGTYDKIVNLTDATQPVINGDAIAWTLKKSSGFYYEGTLTGAQAPLLFEAHYYLDGVKTPAALLAGKAGDMRITLATRPNPDANAAYAGNYMCQIQAALDLDTCSAIRAPQASSIILGRKQNVAFTVLPNKEASYEITLHTDSFSFDGFTMTLMPFDMSTLTGMDTGELQDGVDALKDGTQDLVDGTGDLRDGLAELGDGVAGLHSGAKKLDSGLKDYKEGLTSYTGGVTQLAQQAGQIATNMRQLSDTASTLAANFSALNQGVQGVFTALAPVTPAQLAPQIAALRTQLDAYGQGLAQYSAGMDQMADGMDAFSAGLAQLDASSAPLLEGLKSLVDGMGTLAGGLGRISTEMQKLPDEVQKLIDGQTQLKDGIDEASTLLKDLPAGGSAAVVSFVSDKNKPDSVQFVYQSASVGIEKADSNGISTQNEQPRSLWQKLLDLFRK